MNEPEEELVLTKTPFISHFDQHLAEQIGFNCDSGFVKNAKKIMIASFLIVLLGKKQAANRIRSNRTVSIANRDCHQEYGVTSKKKILLQTSV